MEDKTNTPHEPELGLGVAQLPPFDIAAEAVAMATGATLPKRKSASKENSQGKPPAKRKKVWSAAAKGAPAAPTVISFQADPSLTNQNKKDGIPPWRKIQEMLLTEESVTLAMIQRGILIVPSLCPKCDQTLRFPKKGAIMRCSKCYSRNGGEWSQSLYKGTFFEFGRMKRQDVLMFLYHWLCGAKHKQLCLVMGWSNSTMFRWMTLVVELVATVTFYQDYNPSPRKKTPEEIAAMDAAIVKIGGQDVVVQIDDCPFEKRICAHPDYVKDGWIFCGVEVTPKHRFFSCVVPDRTPASFITLVRKYIHQGSIIRSSRWTSIDIIDIQPNGQYRLEKIVPPVLNNNPHNPFDQPFVNPFHHDPHNPYGHHPMHQPPPHHPHHMNPHHPHAHPQQHHHVPGYPPPHLRQHPMQARQEREREQHRQDLEDERAELWIVPEDATGYPPIGTGANNNNNNATSPTRKHNNVKELQGSLFDFIWRKQHDMNLWNGILWTLKQVKYTD